MKRAGQSGGAKQRSFAITEAESRGESSGSKQERQSGSTLTGPENYEESAWKRNKKKRTIWESKSRCVRAITKPEKSEESSGSKQEEHYSAVSTNWTTRNVRKGRKILES